MAEDNFAMGYALGQDSNNNNCNDGFGGGWGSWIWVILLLAVLGGGWGGGFGGFGGYGGAGLQGMATRADINEGFALNNITGGITAIQQGICDSTYALTNAINGGFSASQMGMMQGFNGVDRGFCDLGRQISDCCCENRAAIADLKYNLATQFCNLGNQIQMQTRDIIDNANANAKGLMDFLVNEKLASKDARIVELTNQLSQSNQNAVIRAAIDASTAEIIRRTGNDCPTPAYWVQPPTPVQAPCSWTNGGYGGGCGCGC